MSVSWLNFLLSRRYAVLGAGDPVPAADFAPACPGASAASAVQEQTAREQGQAGAESSASDNGPFLILPNNVSLLDPAVVYAYFAALKPLVLLHHSQGRGLQMLAGGAQTLVLSDDAPQEVLERAAAALADGRSVLLWPYPQLQRHVRHEEGGASPAFSLLNLLQQKGQRLPELFLVRSEGLWGSRFSCYHLAEGSPSFWGVLCACLPALLLGPLLKRRPVRIVSRRHRLGDKPLHLRSFNTMLQTWYDAGNEGAVLVPMLPLGRIRRMPPEHSAELAPELVQAASSVASGSACARLSPALAPTVPPSAPSSAPPSAPEQNLAAPGQEVAGAPNRVRAAATADVTGLPSVPSGATVSASGALQFSSQPTVPPATSAILGAAGATSGGAAAAGQAQHAAKLDMDKTSSPIGTIFLSESADGASTVKPAVNAPLADIAPAVPRTPPLLPVQHALTRQGSVTDASYAQHFSRRSLLGLAKAIGTLIGPVPATRIGVALPCGAGAMAAYIGVLDCTLENDRIPVLLDPAMSADELAACAQETGISHVLTARQLQGLGLPPDTTPIFLEDITSAQIMRGSALSFMGFAGTTEVEAPAAVFCQAGCAAPLSLSHNDLMGSLHSLIEQLAAAPLHVHSLSILGCLPQHTPLGLLLNTILPLTCGVPIVTVSSPQNDIILARSAEDYSVNCFMGSPQSLRNLLRKARSQLAFRYILLSAEPWPEDLMALLPKACPHAKVFTADMSGEITLLL